MAKHWLRVDTRGSTTVPRAAGFGALPSQSDARATVWYLITKEALAPVAVAYPSCPEPDLAGFKVREASSTA